MRHKVLFLVLQVESMNLRSGATLYKGKVYVYSTLKIPKLKCRHHPICTFKLDLISPSHLENMPPKLSRRLIKLRKKSTTLYVSY